MSSRQTSQVVAFVGRAVRPAIALLLAVTLSLGAAQTRQTLTVLTHDSFSLPAELIAEFTAATGIEVTFLAGGDAGEIVNRVILTKARPIADVLFGIDDSLLERARSEGVLDPYLSSELARVPAEFRFDAEGLVTPIDVGYVLPNVDLAWFEASGLPLPALLEDLADPAYRGLTAVQDPASSSSGLAFLMATVARFGDAAAGVEASVDSGHGDWLDFWAALRDNGVRVTSGWSDAYYTAFTRYGGDRPVVVSYLTSPAAEVIFSEEELTSPPTANLECAGCAYRQIEAAGIIRGTTRRAAAEAFIDFLLSRQVQEAIPLEMFVHPVVAGAALPPEFVEHAVLVDGVAAQGLASSVIQANQRRWLDQWTAVMMQGRSPASVR